MAYTSTNPRFENLILTDQVAGTPDNPKSGSHKIVDRNGVLFIRDSTGTEVAVSAGPGEPSLASNYALATSVSANAMTIALKDKTGSDASAGSPVTIAFRSSTAATGTYSLGTVTGALSITIPSGTTIGTQDGIASNIFVYVIDNAGTVELAVSNRLVDEGSLISTTAISGGSSPVVVYSTTARTSKAIRCLGRVIATEATAGTWATNASEVTVTPFTYSEQNIYSDNSRTLALSTGTTSQTLSAGRRQVLYYRFADGTHRLKFNVSFTLASGGSTANVFAISIAGVTFATYDQRQAVTIMSADFNTVAMQAGCDAAANTIRWYTNSSINGNAAWTICGDVELASKPTWAP